MFEGIIAKKLGGGMFPEKELLDIVHKHAMVAAIVLMLPAPFLEQIFFMVCLWHMYYKLAEYVGEKIGVGTILLGVGINILLVLIYSFLLELLPFVGWLTTGAICYLQFYISGKVYINILREQQPNSKRNVAAISSGSQTKQMATRAHSPSFISRIFKTKGLFQFLVIATIVFFALSALIVNNIGDENGGLAAILLFLNLIAFFVLADKCTS